MISRIEQYLRETTLIPALSGHEQKMAEYMKTQFNSLGIETIEDVFGNCIAKIPGKDSQAPTIMVFAHMDSLGFLVRSIETNGFLRVERVGGIPEKVLPDTEIQVQTENGEMISGTFGFKQHHVTPPEEKYVVDKYMNMFIDIGATSREQVLDLGIDIGSPIVYKPKFQKLQGTCVYASAIDNRGGCAALLELANLLSKSQPEATTYLVGTVQEEYNLRGAMMAARTVNPDIAVSIDVCGAADTPDLEGRGEVFCGKGPVMSLYNFHGRGTLNGTIAHPAMVRLFKKAAQKGDISYQKSVIVGLLTDAAYVQLEGKGVKTIDIGFPGRYSHGPCEMSDMKDIDQLSKWVYTFVHLINKDTTFER